MRFDEYKGIGDLPGVSYEYGSFKEEPYLTEGNFSEERKPVGYKVYEDDEISLILFSWSTDIDNRAFLRYKDEKKRLYITPGMEGDDYVELHGSFHGSSSGARFSGQGTNPWEAITKDIKIFGKGGDLLIDLPGSGNHNFLREVKDSDIIDRELGRKFLKLPLSIKTIRYMCQLKEDPNQVICVDAPAFIPSYNNMRMHVVNLDIPASELVSLSDIETFRDGGTTTMTVNDDYKFFYPNAIGNREAQIPTWNGAPLTRKVDRKTFDKVVEHLGLVFEQGYDIEIHTNPES